MHAELLQRSLNTHTRAQYQEHLILCLEDERTVEWIMRLVEGSCNRLSMKEVAERNVTVRGLWAACWHEWGQFPEVSWFRQLIAHTGITGIRANRSIKTCKMTPIDELVPFTREYLYGAIAQMGEIKYLQ